MSTEVLFRKIEAHCSKKLDTLVKEVEKGWCVKGKKVKEQRPELQKK